MTMIRKIISEKFGNDKKPFLILCMGLLGMLLLCFSCVTSGKSETEISDDTERLSVLEKSTEKKLEELLSSVYGVGRVKTAVTYECTEEYEYASDEKTQGEGKGETEYVITDSGNGDRGLILLITAPKIRGVAVSCDGASSAAVREEVTRLICAVLGIGANKVYVSQMKE